jgi:putative N6-adenine-specific DNA methylase
MCGSGTLSIEAASIAMERSPQRMREYFGFMSWPTFDEALWNDVVNESEANERIPAFPIITTDVDARQVKIARENVRSAGLEHIIKPEVADFFTLEPGHEAGMLVLNPPYGERMDEVQIAHLYKRMGERFKHYWPGFKAWVISSDKEALKEIGLKPFRKQELINGKLICRFVGYELYAGSRRPGNSME